MNNKVLMLPTLIDHLKPVIILSNIKKEFMCKLVILVVCLFSYKQAVHLRSEKRTSLCEEGWREV